MKSGSGCLVCMHVCMYVSILLSSCVVDSAISFKTSAEHMCKHKHTCILCIECIRMLVYLCDDHLSVYVIAIFIFTQVLELKMVLKWIILQML